MMGTVLTHKIFTLTYAHCLDFDSRPSMTDSLESINGNTAQKVDFNIVSYGTFTFSYHFLKKYTFFFLKNTYELKLKIIKFSF